MHDNNEVVSEIKKEKSPNYYARQKAKRKKKKKKQQKKQQRERFVKEQILKSIPEDITELFPQARLLKRKFVLHVGDTNSGKTYDSITACMAAKKGIYLAPLRLLALETQEKMISNGVACSMITGEEENIIEGATHMSCTVEMLDTTKHYDVCVIDEAQLVEDEFRGWAWTKAILGVCAPRVHVCMSENALDIVGKLILSCGDEYRIVRHTRDTKLVVEKKIFDFPENVKDNDALIVFSRNNVLYVASELKKAGIDASVIYGALPYDVRKNELSKFATGKTKVVVSTDAIGMGMNLPVKRIVFLENEKFDGKERRHLTAPEIKQIAGRAGRKGIFNKGYVNALVGRREIGNLLNSEYVPIEKARIQMPERLLDLDMSLIETIKAWQDVTNDELYEKTDSDIILKKCVKMEQLNAISDKRSLTKKEMWNFALIPFDERNASLYALWEHLVTLYLDETDIFIDFDYQFSYGNRLQDLETDYKKLDLYFSFARQLGISNRIKDVIAKEKSDVAKKIIEKLYDVSDQKKKCKRCGRELSWNYRYGICNKCFAHSAEMRGYKKMYKKKQK